MKAIFAVSSAGVRRDGDHFLVPGKLFETGAWPDKQFSLSDAEAERAAKAIAGPLPMDIEHKPSVLDGALGEVRRVWKEGSTLQAEFAVPSWLWQVTRGAGKPLKVSATWDRATKELKGAAWVLDPRIKDAELVAAFSTAQENHRNEPPRAEANPRRAGGVYMTPAQKKLRDLLAERGVGDKLSDDDLDAVFAEERSEQIARDAATFADKMIRQEKRALPKERDYLIAQFSIAAQDDHKDSKETVSFALGEKPKQATRVALLTAAQMARDPHGLTEEKLADPAAGGKSVAGASDRNGKGGDATFGDNDLSLPSAHPSRPAAGTDAAPSTERVSHLLSLSTLGQTALEDMQSRRNGGQ